jgi:hypothetical protein
MECNRPGGWSDWNEVTQKEKDVFDPAIRSIVGVKYTPLFFASQVVAGMNYCFLCKGMIINKEQTMIVASVHIYKPLSGEPHVTEIHRINP